MLPALHLCLHVPCSNYDQWEFVRLCCNGTAECLFVRVGIHVVNREFISKATAYLVFRLSVSQVHTPK